MTDIEVLAKLRIHVNRLAELLGPAHDDSVPWRTKVMDIWNQIAASNIHERYLVEDPDSPQPGDWVAVINDDHCTVRLGGPGHLWQIAAQSATYRDHWQLKGVGSPYPKSMFRRALEREKRAHLNKIT